MEQKSSIFIDDDEEQKGATNEEAVVLAAEEAAGIPPPPRPMPHCSEQFIKLQLPSPSSSSSCTNGPPAAEQLCNTTIVIGEEEGNDTGGEQCQHNGVIKQLAHEKCETHATQKEQSQVECNGEAAEMRTSGLIKSILKKKKKAKQQQEEQLRAVPNENGTFANGNGANGRTIPLPHKEWLEKLKSSAELETMTVLYAKSVLVGSNARSNGEAKHSQRKETIRVPICNEAAIPAANTSKHCHHQNHNGTANLSPSSPPMPRLRVTRIDTLENQKAAAEEAGGFHRSTVCLLPSSAQDSGLMSQSLVMSRSSRVEIDTRKSAMGMDTQDWAGNGTLTKFAQSLPNERGLAERLMMADEGSGWEENGRNVREPRPTPNGCANEQHIYRPTINYRRKFTGRERRKTAGFGLSLCQPNSPLLVRPVGLCHSIRVNNSETMNSEENDKNSHHLPNGQHIPLGFTCSHHAQHVLATSPVPSSSQAGTSSTDSGQGSAGGSPPFGLAYPTAIAEALLQRQRRRASSSEGDSSLEIGEDDNVVAIKEEPLPSYARTASTIDQALRLSSSIFAHLSSAKNHNQNGIKKLLESCRAFLRLLQQSPCHSQMPHNQIELVRRALSDVEDEEEMLAESGCSREAAPLNDYLAVCVRQMLEGCMLVFIRVLCQYLACCSVHDQMLLIGLEHLVHLLLFGDELCLEAIRQKAVDNLLALGLMPHASTSTLKLLLRALAVLCGTAKGCLQLLAIGGLDLVLRSLYDGTDVDCSFEAAGCLAQLCSPAHSFVRPSANGLVPRLLQLVDFALTPESLLLCLAALANLSAQSAGPVCELLYVNNAVLRLIRAAQRQNCSANPFVQEQLVTILTRMANRGHERALLAQGAVPALCRILQPEKMADSKGSRQTELDRRIAYKAAVCLGCLASTGSGLRALHEQGVQKVLRGIGRPENRQRTMTPVQLICASILQKLEITYPQQQLETAV